MLRGAMRLGTYYKYICFVPFLWYSEIKALIYYIIQVKNKRYNILTHSICSTGLYSLKTNFNSVGQIHILTVNQKFWLIFYSNELVESVPVKFSGLVGNRSTCRLFVDS